MVSPSVVGDATIVLPWSSKKKVAHGHRDHITLKCVLVGTYLEGDLHGVLDTKISSIVKPLDLIGMTVFHLDQL